MIKELHQLVLDGTARANNDILHPARQAVRIGPLTIGGAGAAVIAGPCAVEPDFVQQAVALAETGIDALRACVYKPRTHPASFQGLGALAIPLLIEARFRTGLPLVSEVLSAEDAEALGDRVDAYQVGARNMQNVRLLEALGEIGRPVVLKRGLCATVDEWVAASEYMRRRGNDDVISASGASAPSRPAPATLSISARCWSSAS